MRSFVTVIALLLFAILVIALAKRSIDRSREQQRELREYQECQQTPGCIWQ